jgi:hypothetical protein
MTRAVQADREGLIASVVSMIIPRLVLALILTEVPSLVPDPQAVNPLVATIGAPGLAGLVRVAVARRDVSTGS